MTATVRTMRQASRRDWRQVGVPREHGGWGLTAEPIVLGLIVAWSATGFVLGLAAMLAFLLRTPLKLTLIDARHGVRLDRTTLAAGTAAAESVVLVGLAAVVVSRAGIEHLWPLAIAVPLVVGEFFYEVRGRGRRLVPELAGTVAMASIATAIGLIGGLDTGVAIGLWLVLAARAVASVPYVRQQLLRSKGRVGRPAIGSGAQLVAVGMVTAGWMIGWSPGLAVAVIAALGAVHLMQLRRPPPPVVVIGIQQLLAGALVVAVTAYGVLGS